MGYLNKLMKKKISLTLILLYSFVLIVKGYFALCCYEFESFKSSAEIAISDDHCVHHHDEITKQKSEKNKNDCASCFEINKNIYWAFQKNLTHKSIADNDSFDFCNIPESAFNILCKGEGICFDVNHCFRPYLSESGNSPVFKLYSVLLRI
jgi:hypothetical protein